MDEDLGVFEGLGEALDQLLDKQPESAAELSEAVGVTRSSLSRYRRGRGLPSLGALGRLLRRCGVTLGEFEDLLIEARGEGPPDAAEHSIGPTYIPLGLLVVPLEDQPSQAPNRREFHRYLRQALASYQVARKPKQSGEGEDTSDK